MINPALIDQIDKYLLGQLSEEEARHFLQQLRANPAEQEIFELLQNIAPAYQEEMVADLKSKMQQWDKEEKVRPSNQPKIIASAAESTAPRITRRTWLSAAAVGLALLAATLYFWQSEPVLTGPELFAQHFEPYPYAGIERSAGIDRTNQAYILYNAGQYDRAIEGLSELDDIQAIFFLAQAEMASKKYQSAISHLKTYLSQGGSFQSQAKWSLALSHLALNMQDESQTVLKNLATENSSYGKKAISLIAQMKQ